MITAASLRSWPERLGLAESRIPALKELLVEAVASVEREEPGYAGKLGILADETYGQDALNAATGRGWWIGRPVELPGSNPLAIRARPLHRHQFDLLAEASMLPSALSFIIPTTRTEHRLEQEAQVRALYEATRVSGHELLLEVIPPKDRTQPDTVYRSLQAVLRSGYQTGMVEAGVDDGRSVASY